MNSKSPWQGVATAQGAFYLITGLWPLLHRRSFEVVTGPKKYWWLVQTVASLVSVVGTSLLITRKEPRPRTETVALAIGSALALAAIDVIHTQKKTIRPVYRADAAAEGLLTLAWIWSLRRDWKRNQRNDDLSLTRELAGYQA